jgi:serine protease Do
LKPTWKSTHKVRDRGEQGRKLELRRAIEVKCATTCAATLSRRPIQLKESSMNGFSWYAGTPGIAAALLLALVPAGAQESEEAWVSAESRQQLYRELSADVDALERQGNVLKRVVRFAKPSVVHIEAARVDSEEKSADVEEAGSGVVVEINRRPYILTNRHVIKDSIPTRIKIKLADGRLAYPTKVWSDRGTDIAVMAVNVPHLVAANIGDSDKVEIGDFVLAVGSPFGLSHSVTYGIISAKGRRDLELGDDGVRFQDFMQTDAAINPGNSGGPLLNLRGEVIGLNTAIASSSGGNEGIGFTIPINMAMSVAEQLTERGAVVRAFLGVHLDSKFSAETASKLGLPRVEGARVSGITSGSPAELAQIRVGDVILQFDGRRIEDDGHLVNLVSTTPIEKEVAVTLFREGKAVAVRVKVGDRGRFEPEPR